MRARGRGHVAADFHVDGQSGRRAVARTRLERIRKLVAAVGGQRLHRAVARKEDRIRPTAERVAAEDVDSGGHVPAGLHLSIGAEAGRREPRVHHPHGVERRGHPPIDGVDIGGAGAGADVDVAVLGGGGSRGCVVRHADRLVVGHEVVLDHVEGMVVIALAPGRVLGEGGQAQARAPHVEAVEPTGR